MTPPRRQVRAIPIAAAKRIAQAYGYDQVIVIGRRLDKVGEDGEHMTAFGRNETDQWMAESLGNLARRKILGAS